MSAKVYLNGELKALEDACIPVMDRGFLFGDSVYEVIPAYGGRLFRLTEHLDRLTNSLHAIHMQNPLSHEQWNQVLTALVAQHPGRDQGVYLQVTRGSAEKRDHAFPAEVHPTVFVMTTPLLPPPRRMDSTPKPANATTIRPTMILAIVPWLLLRIS
jgi:D-alanine transaminase